MNNLIAWHSTVTNTVKMNVIESLKKFMLTTSKFESSLICNSNELIWTIQAMI